MSRATTLHRQDDDSFELSLIATRSTTSLAGALRSGRLNLLFNLRGRALLLGAQGCINLLPNMMSALLMPCSSSGISGQVQDQGQGCLFLSLAINTSWLEHVFAQTGAQDSTPALACYNLDRQSHLPATKAMTLSERELVKDLITPPVADEVLDIWYQAKITEILAVHFFRSDDREPFAPPSGRKKQEKLDKAKVWIKEHLDEKFSLELLASDIGCSPAHISRIYSEELGMTISQSLRAERMELATKLLESGSYNISEIAVEVGYSSLSHFTKVFRATHGITPSQFLRSLQNS